jgi:signal transduction histidine kinase
VNDSTLKRRLALVFLAVGVVTAVGVVLAVLTALRLHDAQQRTTEYSFASFALAADLRRSILDQEAAFSDYAVSRDPELLEDYAAARRRERELARELAPNDRRLGGLDQPRQEVSRRAAEWRAAVVEPALTAVRTGGQVSPSQVVAGNRRFTAVRTAMDAYEAQILQRRNASKAELHRATDLLFAVVAGGVLLILLCAGLAWWALRRWVAGPLERLGAEVGRVEAGDLSHVVHLAHAPAEVGQLAEQVDRMRMRILEEYALALEARQEAVEARRLVEAQAEDLRRSNGELEQFAYVASHDLQEPLRKVASFCQLLERRYKGQLDERGEQYIEFAVDGAKRMQRLISDLLAFSRVGRLTGDFTDVPLERTLEQALRQLQAVLEETSAVVTHDQLPTVRGDASLLVQLFQNLVGNGVKFRGAAAPRVHIGARPGNGEWELSCSDNGIGIEPQYADKIFVIFQRLHGRDAYDGTGIGLAMCKKIVEHHGGRMWLDPSATEGATFRWTLPVTTGGPGEDQHR